MNVRLPKDNLIAFLILILTCTYTAIYSLVLSNQNIGLLSIGLFMTILLLFFDSEKLLYCLFFFLPFRKLIYLDSFAFFNVVLIILFLKIVLETKKIPIISIMIALIISLYDIIVSMNAVPSFSLNSYMIKWYFSVLVFFTILENKFKKFNFVISTICLNIGLFITGVLTISQYLPYGGIVSGSLRDLLQGCGGTLDQNTYSFFCLISAISAFSCVVSKKTLSIKESIILIFLSIFNLIVGFFMISKAFVVVLIILAFLLIIYSFINLKISLKYISILILTGIVLFQIPVIQNIFNSLVLRFSSVNDMDSLTTGRVDLFNYYLDSIIGDTKGFLFGAGLSTYSTYYSSNYITHNTILELIASWGIIGTIIFVGFISYYCKRFISGRGYPKISFYSLLPLITFILFSQTLSMLWEDASLFFMLFSIFFAVSMKKTNDYVGDNLCSRNLQYVY